MSKVVLVTGGGRGIGAATARLAAARGHAVVINYLHDGASAQTVAGAIDTLTLGLAREVAGEGIRVNAVRPGIIRTDIHVSGGDPERAERLGPGLPMRRAGTPDEVAHAILWLAGEESGYCTGSILDVAGGR